MAVKISRENKRGCGYRRIGGMYLVCDGPGHPCEILPLELHVCGTCGQGIKPARGWTWIDSLEMFKHEHCPKCSKNIPVISVPAGTDIKDLPVTPHNMHYCQFTQERKAGLIWIGEQFYPTPGHFNKEAESMGVSRRITCIPRDFQLGLTWVLLAHRKVNFREKDEKRVNMCNFEMIDELEDERPGIFTAFLPSRIEKIVDENATETEVRQIEEDGMTPVQVVRLGKTQDLFDFKEKNDET